MKKKNAFLGLSLCIFLLFAISFVERQSNVRVAWGVYSLTKCDSAATVSGTGVAIGASQAIGSALRGASWGARLGAYAGPIGIVGGALVGGL